MTSHIITTFLFFFFFEKKVKSNFDRNDFSLFFQILVNIDTLYQMSSRVNQA